MPDHHPVPALPSRDCKGAVRSTPESGFALLFVYAMAATVAIMLYMSLPRVAFEAQRDKEQLLIDRGEQYSRGIQLFVRKFNRYPTDFEALDSTQNIRFLRHRYTDPMTSKEEWRIIHVGPGGVFTDSLLYTKKKDDKTPEKQTFITELAPIGGNPTDPNQQLNLAARRRASDQAGAPGDPNNPAAPVDPNAPNQPNINGFPQGVQLPPGAQLPPGVQPPPGVQLPGVAPQPGQNPNAPPSSAAAMINNLLTTPRPGGFPGIQNGQQPQQPGQPTVDQFGNAMPGQQTTAVLGGAQPQQAGQQPQQPAAQTIGGGIAGIASKIEQDGIKMYRDHQAYNEWEFVYDISKDTSRPGGGAQQQVPGQNANQNQNQNQNSGQRPVNGVPNLPTSSVPQGFPMVPPK